MRSPKSRAAEPNWPRPAVAPQGMTEQADDEPPQPAGDIRRALIVGAGTVAALVVAGVSGTALVLQSHGSNTGKSLGAVGVSPVDVRPSMSASASPVITPSPSPSPSPSASPTPPASPSPSTSAARPSGPVPSQGFGPLATGTYTIDHTITTTSNLVLTLTQITVASGGTVTVDVSYHNTTSSPIALACGGALDSAAVNLLTRSDGKQYKATRSYCSDNPKANLFELTASGTSQSYAIFTGVTGQNNDFEFTWQSGQSITGTVSGIIL